MVRLRVVGGLVAICRSRDDPVVVFIRSYQSKASFVNRTDVEWGWPSVGEDEGQESQEISYQAASDAVVDRIRVRPRYRIARYDLSLDRFAVS